MECKRTVSCKTDTNVRPASEQPTKKRMPEILREERVSEVVVHLGS